MEDIDPKALHFIPLGGSEEFGVNFNIYAYEDKFLAIDLGMGFADERLPGIDLILPELSFLEDRSDDLVALIITHAHEDHVGAVARLWKRLRCPVYCSAFTASVLRHKLREMGIEGDVEVNIVAPGETVEVRPFSLRFVHMAHSIPDTCAVVVETPVGKVFHSGDWNLDHSPVIGPPTDEDTIRKIGESGVLAYIGDSTNSNVPGRAGSESEVEEGLEQVFRECDGRIAVTMFASNVQRIRSICKAAKACGRDVAVIGRSLHTMIGAARDCGYLNDVQDFVPEEELELLPDDKQVAIVTGSQGEYRAALARIARGDNRLYSLGEGDTVIFSARPIPGNEKDIDTVKNNLSAGGVRVITPGDVPYKIHVSGHPCQDEVLDMFRWLKPGIVVPVHGERLQIEAHADLARKAQVPQVVVPNNGSVIRLAPGQAEIVDHVETGLIAVGQNERLMSVDHISIIERRKLQYTGAVHVSLVLDGRGDVVSGPVITTIGLCDLEEDDFESQLLDELDEILRDMTTEDLEDDGFIQEELRIGTRRFCQHILGLKPKTTVHLVRV